MRGWLWRTCLVACGVWYCLAVASTSLAAEATYQVTFDNLWNPVDHPRNYPSSAHFSPLVGASHNSDVSFWSPGTLASPGVEQVAETGGTSLFLNEVSSATNAGTALQSLRGSNIFRGQSVTREIDVSSDFPLLTVLSMIAPSPDWFVGIHDYDLREGNGFVASRTFEFTSFYDAGTEDGSGFTLSNPATNPAVNIFAVTGDDARNLFVNSGSTGPGPRGGQVDPAELPPIARLTLTRVSQTVPEPGAFALAALALSLLLGTRAQRETRQR